MKLTTIHTGLFKLDGGAMFGIVPRRLWAKLNPPDENNLCTWAMRAMLVETDDGRRILIDTGLGNKQDEKFRQHFQPHGEFTLFDSLAQAGFQRDDISDVLLTHLHFDHCGGALWRNPETGAVEPAFPKATYWTNQRHFDWAANPNFREKASFLPENFLPLQQQGRLRFVDPRPDAEFAPGVRLRFTNGHTESMTLAYLDAGNRTVVYCADTLPSQFHLGLAYGMAYDIRPLDELAEKAALLEEAEREGQLLFFEHDPVSECATIRRDDAGRLVTDQTGRLKDLNI